MENHRTDHVGVVPPLFLGGPHKVSVTLIGAGGTGSHLLDGLAQLDRTIRLLGHNGLFVTVYDDDVVEPHNIGRQAFGFNDLGENKAHALIARVNRMWHTRWIASSNRFNPPDESAGMLGNIILTAVDHNATRNRIHELFRSGFSRPDLEVQQEHEEMLRTHYWVDVGNEKDFGQIVLGGKYLPDCVEVKQANTGSVYDEQDAGGPSCSAQESLAQQDLFINRIMAAHALDMIWNIFRKGVILRSAIYVNINQQTYSVRATKTTNNGTQKNVHEARKRTARVRRSK